MQHTHQFPARPSRQTAVLGDLIVAAFDAAETVCPDRRRARRVATRTVTELLRSGRARLPRG